MKGVKIRKRGIRNQLVKIPYFSLAQGIDEKSFRELRQKETLTAKKFPQGKPLK